MQKREKAAWGLCILLAAGLAAVIILRSAGGSAGSAVSSNDASVQAKGVYSPNANYEYLVGSTVWQLSAESHSLMEQAFTGAKRQVDIYRGYCEDASDNDYSYETADDGKQYMTYKGKHIAVICDIDDALVDGAHYTANIIGKDGDINNAAFSRFLMSDDLSALPGAVDFVNYCTDNGMEVFYVTNRSDQGYKVGQSDSQGSYDEVTAKAGEGTYMAKDGTLVGTTLYQTYGKSAFDITMETMKKLGFPIDEDHLFINDQKVTGHDKDEVRNAIEKGAEGYPNGQRSDGNVTGNATQTSLKPHEVAMLVGDNLADFSSDFSAEGLDAVSRAELIEKYNDFWGTKWIVLPNAVYGNSMDYAMKYGFPQLLDHYDYTNAR